MSSEILNDHIFSLRADIQLHSGAPHASGMPTWLIFDPIRESYFKISWPQFEMLSRWQLGGVNAIASAVSNETTLSVVGEDVLKLNQFLRENFLTRLESDEEREWWSSVASKKKSSFTSLTHSYIFFRIPILRPREKILKLYSISRVIFSRYMFVFFAICLAMSFYVVLQDWDRFLATLPSGATFHGFIVFSLALVIAKIWHEAGHAIAAARHRVGVPSMGVAFMVMWPVLYTDVTHAWRLKSRGARVQIGLSGLVFECALASIAAILWGITPPGPVNSALFAVATIGWVSSILINLNPLMRFDAYYVLSDVFDVENLQERSFALGRWWMRKILFGIDVQPPDFLGRQKRNLLILYAYLVWLYRLFLYIGIAVLVYHFFFKVLGIFLFVLELYIFIFRPLSREFFTVARLRNQMRVFPNLLFFFGTITLLVTLVMFPFKHSVEFGGLLTPQEVYDVYAPEAGLLTSVPKKNGEKASQGEIIAEITVQELEDESRALALKSESLAARLRVARLGLDSAEDPVVLAGELIRARDERAGIDLRIDNLRVKAPFEGVVVDLAPGIVSGVYITDDAPMMSLIHLGEWKIVAYVSEAERSRISVGAAGTFNTGDLKNPELPVEVRKISDTAVSEITRLELTSVHGGPVAVRQLTDGKLVPETAHFRVELALPNGLDISRTRILRGTVEVDGTSRSYASIWLERLQAFLVRESWI